MKRLSIFLYIFISILLLNCGGGTTSSSGLDTATVDSNSDESSSTSLESSTNTESSTSTSGEGDEHDESDEESTSTNSETTNTTESSTTTTTTSTSTTTPYTPSITLNTGSYMLSAWNDLGMHCMDGNDYSVFSILPPYNNLHAQIKNKSGDLVTSGITITYEATTGMDGKINTTTYTKTNFWDYVTDLFGASPNSDIGLTGNPTPSTTPKELVYNSMHGYWEAEGIPISPYNDDGTKNYYPLVKVVAKDSNGNILAETKTVLPVSDEMDCKRCHASTSTSSDAKPSSGWVNESDGEKDYKLNILRLHDQKHPTAVKDNTNDLTLKGYIYNEAGLETTANNGTPILCVACHKSNALPNVGIGLKPLTQAIHAKHANVIDPNTNTKLSDISNRTSCYACHPGSKTECLRGAMGAPKNSDGTNVMDCQSCHGTMSHVGDSTREGWLDQPNCQACHHDGKREVTAIDPLTNTLRAVVDSKFATLPNTPTTGKSLYRYSTGHGNLQCEACHGSTHAIYPANSADNLVSLSVQGHTGTIGECSACHSTVPKTVTGGPHGMHPVGSSWVHDHEDAAERDATQCKTCHGSDYRGSFLSATFTDRSFSTEWGTKSFPKGTKVGCYDCHNGPSGD